MTPKKRRRRKPLGAATLADTIKPGCMVTILTPQNQQRTGRAVMRGPHGWVLNMGGRHGTPGIASSANVVRVTCKNR